MCRGAGFLLAMAMLLWPWCGPRRAAGDAQGARCTGDQDFDPGRASCRPHGLGLGLGVLAPAALPVRAEEVDQDGGDYLRRGVVIISVEHLEPRTWRGSGLFRD